MAIAEQTPAFNHLDHLVMKFWARWSIMMLLCMMLVRPAYGQGDLSYLKNIAYLDIYYDHPFNCDSLADDQVSTMTDRICANLRLQRSDSLLTLYYDSLLVETRRIGGDTLRRAFDELQRSWRTYRDEHCKALVGEVTGNWSAAAFMDEMRALTDIRIEELKQLLELYRSGAR
jgi:uncharacterized protein YecT (DUF1311 family)